MYLTQKNRRTSPQFPLKPYIRSQDYRETLSQIEYLRAI